MAGCACEGYESAIDVLRAQYVCASCRSQGFPHHSNLWPSINGQCVPHARYWPSQRSPVVTIQHGSHWSKHILPRLLGVISVRVKVRCTASTTLRVSFSTVSPFLIRSLVRLLLGLPCIQVSFPGAAALAHLLIKSNGSAIAVPELLRLWAYPAFIYSPFFHHRVRGPALSCTSQRCSDSSG